jgi:hypothetical protein
MRLNRRKLCRYTVEEILRLAQFGNVLIRGWGAGTLLQNIPQIISVRVCAPMEHRVHVVMERLGGEDANTVRQEIERYEASRRRAMRALFNVEEEDPRLYHLVLNTERLSLEACVKAICELAESPRFQKGAATRAVADKLLETRISTALTENISVSMAPLGIAVSVAGGKITLACTTSNGSLRAKAEKIARSVAGGSEIDNRIISVPSHGSRFAPYSDRATPSL